MTLVVVGGAGFIGSHTAAHLAGQTGLPVRWAIHQRPLGHRLAPRHEVRTVDLTDPSSLTGLADGATAVLHLGHRLDGTPAELHAVNARGVQVLLDECERAGVERVVRLSTAAVYGAGPWRGQSARTLATAPLSPTSTSRLAGDLLVQEFGGTVVRPHLVHGPGDRWFVPRALDLVQRIGWVEEGAARHSMIAARDLAVRLVQLCLAPGPVPPVVIAAEPRPTRMRDFLSAALRAIGRPVPARSTSLDEALDHPAGSGDHRWRHDIGLLATDHYLDAGSCPT